MEKSSKAGAGAKKSAKKDEEVKGFDELDKLISDAKKYKENFDKIYRIRPNCQNPENAFLNRARNTEELFFDHSRQNEDSKNIIHLYRDTMLNARNGTEEGTINPKKNLISRRVLIADILAQQTQITDKKFWGENLYKYGDKSSKDERFNLYDDNSEPLPFFAMYYANYIYKQDKQNYYARRTHNYCDHRGNYWLKKLGAYGDKDCLPKINKFLSNNAKNRIHLVDIMLEFSKGNMKEFHKKLLQAIPKDLQKMIFLVCSNLFHKEPSRYFLANSHSMHLPMATAQMQVLQLIKHNKATFEDYLDFKGKYAVFSTKKFLQNQDPLRERIILIQNDYRELLRDLLIKDLVNKKDIYVGFYKENENTIPKDKLKPITAHINFLNEKLFSINPSKMDALSDVFEEQTLKKSSEAKKSSSSKPLYLSLRKKGIRKKLLFQYGGNSDSEGSGYTSSDSESDSSFEPYEPCMGNNKTCKR